MLNVCVCSCVCAYECSYMLTCVCVRVVVITAMDLALSMLCKKRADITITCDD